MLNTMMGKEQFSQTVSAINGICPIHATWLTPEANYDSKPELRSFYVYEQFLGWYNSKRLGRFIEGISISLLHPKFFSTFRNAMT